LTFPPLSGLQGDVIPGGGDGRGQDKFYTPQRKLIMSAWMAGPEGWLTLGTLAGREIVVI